MKAKYFFIIFFIFVVGCKTKQKTILEEEKPVVLLISIDGFRYDYIHKVITAGINQIRNGVEAEWLIPSFPSKTFPNHYTIVTGLYPEHHGIIANNMYDDNFNAVYRISDTKEKNNSRWWGGEPIWVTAEKQGLTSACFFWPGSEAAIQNVRPKYWKNYDHNFPNINRVDTILHWMNLPKESRPQFMSLYFSDVDDAGHTYGPDSKEVLDAIKRVDGSIQYLIEKLKAQNLFEKTNIIIVSDHGMKNTNTSNVNFIDDYINMNWLQNSFLDEVSLLYPKKGMEDSIMNAFDNKPHPEFEVYRKKDVPSRFHYNKHSRIPEIVIVTKPGWKNTTHNYFERTKGRWSLGSHGWDNLDEDMRAVFYAHGPAFKKGFKAKAFENINVYNLLCKILNIKPATNDGNNETVSQMLR